MKLEYAAPADNSDLPTIISQADKHFEYVVLSDSYVLVAPTKAANPTTPKPTTGGTETGQSSPAAANNATAPAATTVAGSTTNRVAAQGSRATTHTAGSASRSSSRTGTTAAQPATSARPAAAATAGAATTPGTAVPGTSQTTGTGSQTPTPSPPPTLDNPFDSTSIDGQSWSANIVPMPNPAYSFMVKGYSGFWESTTIGVTRYQNSDLVSSISSTAQNLVPTRIGQIAGIAASVVKIAAAGGVAGSIPPKPIALTAFSFKVPATGEDSGTINDDWSWGFAYDDSALPKGTVSFTNFIATTTSKKVGYWPVEACRSATLTLHRKTAQTSTWVFHFVVSSPDSLRLQPLPVSGKVALGTSCGSSTSGTATADQFANVSDDFAAAQKAVALLKKPSTAPATP